MFASLATAAAPSHAQDAPPAPTWQPVPIVTPRTLEAGFTPGGEGGQWYRDIQVSRSDPNFLVLAIDVGGIYRTHDGGRRWEPANAGYSARGCNAVAIDPRDAKRILAVAGNSLDWRPDLGPQSPHGLYLSTDAAASWAQVLERNEGTGAAYEGSGGAVAFDPSSFDAAKGFCTIAYFAPRDGGVFRSTDGGATWAKAADGFGRARLMVSDTGHVYLAGTGEKGSTRGLHRSTDGGRTFDRLLDQPVHGLDIEHGRVYVSGDFGVRASTDGGETFADVGPLAGLDRQNDKPVLNVTVSPADAAHLAAWVQGDNWNWVRHVSHDAGRTWHESKWDNTLSTLPYNRRQGHWAFHPTDPDVIHSVGGDWVTRSTNGGRTFAWFSNGYNGTMLGRSFNFSPTSPDALCLFFQDYNGAVTRDGGRSWAYYDVSGKGWGGYCYGGYTPDGTVIFGGDAKGWGDPRKLRVSHDAGKTWSTATDAAGKEIVFTGFDVGYSDPTNPDVCFASNWRSDDRGRTWRPMDGCDGVFTSNPAGGRELFGRSGTSVVRSADHGATWQPVAELPDKAGKINDVAYDHERDRLYVVSGNKLHVHAAGRWATIDTPKDQRGNSRLESVAVDPQDPSVVYACGPANIYLSHATVARSTDAGETWTNLTNTRPLTTVGQSADGPHECQWVRVHPVTREAWVNGQCFGMWKIAPPARAATAGK
jgi:photosystem II stability/assembly factor-like uncharacterized protein